MSKYEGCNHCMEMGEYFLKGLQQGFKRELTDDEKLKCKECNEYKNNKCIRVGTNGKIGVCWMEKSEGEY